MKVWPEFLAASIPASAPVLRLRPTSKPCWAPKFMFMPWAMASEIMASSAETAGSLIVSMIASTSASRASLRMRRTINLVACVAPAAPISDRPSVNGAAACAAMISAARIANWAITATFIPTITTDPASIAKAINSAAVRASSR
ncbi:hypothetical protein [Streptomyces endophytica]|uniref:Uncharacterized protein n=1 Tax=Streptomyces endophytica TaxID=2991496 RepID=A0ABY6PBV2_9ACTN|nr:hypothetical protein [Streptomyces endophytica]UZJ31304.1 hypothetical protein OJ254_14480 [Streptomyces endophytica]